MLEQENNLADRMNLQEICKAAQPSERKDLATRILELKNEVIALLGQLAALLSTTPNSDNSE